MKITKLKNEIMKKTNKLGLVLDSYGLISFKLIIEEGANLAIILSLILKMVMTKGNNTIQLSYSYINSNTNLTTATISKILKRLVELNLISIKNNNGRTNLISINSIEVNKYF